MRALWAVGRSLAVVAVFSCAGPARVAAPTIAESAPPASAPSPPGPKGNVCDLLRDVPAARELAREMNGDVTILKYSVDFREHAEVVAKARGVGVASAQPFVILGAHALGPHGARSIVVRGVDGDPLHVLKKYVVAGTLDALEHDGEVADVGVGVELAEALGVPLGGEITIAMRDEHTTSPKPTALRRARVGAILRFPGGESLTAFGSTAVLTTMARAAAFDPAMPNGGATGVIAWTDRSRAESEWVDALTAALANGIYHVVPASQLDAGFRASIGALEAYCRR